MPIEIFKKRTTGDGFTTRSLPDDFNFEGSGFQKAGFQLGKPPGQVSEEPVQAAREDIVPASSDVEDNIVDGTDKLRDEETLVRRNAQDALSELDALDDLMGTQLTQGLANVTDLVNQTKELTDMDLDRIEQAAQAAGAQFDPLIEQARESKRQGLARATVGAGERGGFENTQFAGQATLTPTEGGTFVGAGGELSKIKGQLDQNISRLETAKQQAIAAARAAERKAIRTGKKEDAAMAMDLLNQTKDIFETQQNAINKRIDVVTKLENQQRARVEFGQEQVDRALDQLATQAELGIDSINLPTETTDAIEREFGPEFIEQYLTATRLAKEAESEEDQIEAMNKITQILARTPEGIEVPIGDSVYTGFKEGDNRTYKEVNKNTGQVTYITLDNDGNIVSTAEGGNVGVSRSGTRDTSGSGVSDNTIQELLDSRGEDGFVNTELYSDALDEAAISGAKAVRNFLAQFPVETYLNPNDPTARRFLNTQTQALKSGEPDEDDFLQEYLNS